MPRDNKTPLIQKIAKQAFVTFKGLESSSGVDSQAAAEQLGELISLVTAVRAADLKVAPRKHKPSPGAAGPHNPPVTYMHICETEVFSMGVFLLRAGASIPLHDHPGMNGMLKVLYGKVNVRGFDKLEERPAVAAPPAGPQPPPVAPELAPPPLWRAALRSAAEFSETSGPCLLSPGRDNLHQIHAVDGPAAFLDILAPPYNPEDGRDCHYYQVLPAGAGGPEAGGPPEQLGGGQEREEGEVWLLEVPQPEDFWCGGEPYPGPPVSV
ncbi:LOW QUALITY PROTEIN: 2-aminoethanethiol (cysteamine) dioxygenase a [Menidia menidia]